MAGRGSSKEVFILSVKSSLDIGTSFSSFSALLTSFLKLSKDVGVFFAFILRALGVSLSVLLDPNPLLLDVDDAEPGVLRSRNLWSRPSSSSTDSSRLIH